MGKKKHKAKTRAHDKKFNRRRTSQQLSPTQHLRGVAPQKMKNQKVQGITDTKTDTSVARQQSSEKKKRQTNSRNPRHPGDRMSPMTVGLKPSH